jgi:hypothetical protein
VGVQVPPPTPLKALCRTSAERETTQRKGLLCSLGEARSAPLDPTHEKVFVVEVADTGGSDGTVWGFPVVLVFTEENEWLIGRISQ